jgi:hypothetical protein
MKWANLIARLINSITRTGFEPATILERADSVKTETVQSIVLALGYKRVEKKALASLAAVLLTSPEYGKLIPLSVLERYLDNDQFPCACGKDWRSYCCTQTIAMQLRNG